jgi:hypothetical protein
MDGILLETTIVLTELTMITERMLPEPWSCRWNGKGVAGVVWNVKMLNAKFFGGTEHWQIKKQLIISLI